MNNSLASLKTSNLPYSVFWMIICVSIMTYKHPIISPMNDDKKASAEMKIVTILKTKQLITDPMKMYYRLNKVLLIF